MNTCSTWFNIKSLDSKINALKSNGFTLQHEDNNYLSLAYTDYVVYHCLNGEYKNWICSIYIDKEKGNCSLSYSKH